MPFAALKLIMVIALFVTITFCDGKATYFQNKDFFLKTSQLIVVIRTFWFLSSPVPHTFPRPPQLFYDHQHRERDDKYCSIPVKYVRIASILFFSGTLLPVYLIPMVLGAHNIALYTLYSFFFISFSFELNILWCWESKYFIWEIRHLTYQNNKLDIISVPTIHYHLIYTNTSNNLSVWKDFKFYIKNSIGLDFQG
jgi:hypothetical protein